MARTRWVGGLIVLMVGGGVWANTVIEPQNVLTYTPVNGSASFTMSDCSQTWAYNDDQAVQADKACTSVDGAYGGVVYKFVSTTGQPMILNATINYYFGNWSGRKVTAYYSDVNDWSQLSPMTGSRWDGWGETWEVDPDWSRLDSFRVWGGDDIVGSLRGDNLSTTDGTFYLRVDLSSANAPPQSVYFGGLSWTGVTASLRGTVSLPGYTGNLTAMCVTVDLVQGGTVVQSQTVFLDEAGQFTVPNVMPGEYDIRIKVPHSVSALLSGVNVAADPTDLPAVILKCGDINGDDQISFEDFAILQNNYGQRGGSAAAVTPRTTMPHAVDGILSAGEWASLYSDPVPDKPSSGCVELARWGAEVRDGVLYGAFELDPAGHDVAYYDNFAAGNRLWLGLWIDADPAADPVTGVADGDDQFAPPRAQDINIELGMDNGSLVCRTADWNSLNFWGRDNSFNNITPVTVNAAYQGHVVEFAVPVADILAELARTDGAVPGNIWKIGARAAGHVSGEDYNGDITVLQSVTVFGIEGAVTLQDYQGDNATLGIQCIFTPTGSGDPVFRKTLVNADGTFRLDPVPVGTYNVTVKSGTSLSAALSNVSVGSSVTDLGSIELVNADINGDDRVGFEDFSILQNNYGESGAAATPPPAAAVAGCGGLGLIVLSFLGLMLLALRLQSE